MVREWVFTRTIHRLFGRRIMMGSRIIIAALMAMLWSLIPTRAHCDSCLSGLDSHARISAHFHSARDCDELSESAQTFFQIAKPWKRRVTSSSNPNENTGTVFNERSRVPDPVNLSGAGDTLGFSAVLAQSWQFELRTAASPRAPSFLLVFSRSFLRQ